MDKVIIYQLNDSPVSIVRPSPASRLEIMVKPAVYEEDGSLVSDQVMRPETDDEFVQRIALLAVPPGVPFQIISASEIPEDRTFRDAWQAEITEPDGHGADYGVGSSNHVVGWDERAAPILGGAE